MQSSDRQVDQDSLSDRVVLKLRHEIGDASGPEELQFTKITSAFLLDDGRVVAVNYSKPPEVRVFNADGEHERSIGHEGGGPGEFRAISWVRRVAGDTLVAYDMWQSRLTYMSADGRILRVVNAPVGNGYHGMFVLLAVLPDTTGIAMPNMRTPPPGSRHGRAVTQILHFDRAGHGKVILRVPDLEFGPAPKSKLRATEAVIMGLESDIEVFDSTIFITTGDKLGFEEYDLNGKRLRFIAAPHRRRTVTRADVAGYRAQLMEKWGSDKRTRRSIAENFRIQPVAKQLPATSTDWNSVIRDSRSNVWVAEYPAPSGRFAHWTIFSPSGRKIGRLTLPRNCRVVSVSDDKVVVVAKDDLGVQSVRVYDLTLR